jgi:hypothetical protein
VQQLSDAELIQQQIAMIRQQVKVSGAQWVDDEFRADDASLYRNPDDKPDYDMESIIEWKRPEEICQGEDPVMIKDGVSANDVKQGKLGDCWLLGSFLLLGTRQQLLRNLIVEGNSIKEGFAVFQFFKNGKWVPVFVDTLLPYDTSSKSLLYGHCTDTQEFWVPLLEKAYAKLHGCYEVLNGG